ncbi:PREDICTED: uncharacterized protein LOC109217476 [Nicotiana attenuata]|uniref:uncharacterized protein LOC109217476 n=1 Tax=Nicotiana attenuata TaxID=49451 RepID=UPI00090494E5|nr:PREDICTED: uncharacterized protein LOC109217476 [Nicotiana attenuata]
MVPQPYVVMNAQPYVRPQQQFNQNRAPVPRNQPPRQAQYNPRPPQNNFPYNARAREPPRMANFTSIGESYSSLFPKFVQMGLLQPVPQTRHNLESPSYRAGTRCAYHSGAEGHDTDDCWTLKRAVENLIEQKRIVLKDEDVPNVTNNPLPTHNNGPIIGMICEDKEFHLALKAIIAIADVEKKSKAAVKQDKGEKKSKPTPQNTEKKVETETGEAPSKDAILYVPRGHKKEQMSLSPPRRFELNKGSKMYVPKGTYVVRGPAVVTYKGKEVLGETNETNPAEKYLNLEEVNNATKKRFPIKKPVSAEEAEEFFQKMKTADYEIVDQLRKSPAQVSLLSLLMNSTEHQKVLIKTLNEAYVLIETTVEQLERMAERFFAINQISFSKNDLPPEGAAHNKALHLTVKCEGYYVKRVMLDGGSGVDIALSQLCKEWRSVLRESGPTTPWIHTAGAVPSTLHQMVKFEHEDQEIVVHGEDEQPIYQDPSVPCLEAREGSEHIVYQAFEVVVADHCEEGNPCPQPFLSNASIMVAKEMIRHGYKPEGARDIIARNH